MHEILVRWERCTGCGDCLTACADEMMQQAMPQPQVPRLDIRGKELPAYIAICRHCADAPCRDACISGAITRTSAGRVELADAVCVRCCMCLAHCPFGALSLVGDQVIKCDICTPAGTRPPCVRACPEGALSTGTAERFSITRGRERAERKMDAIQPQVLLPSQISSTISVAATEPAESWRNLSAGTDTAPAVSRQTKRVIIIGASAAGSAAAWALRRLDQACSITLVSDEPVPAYSRCLLSDYFLGQIGPERLAFLPLNWRDALNAAIVQEAAVAIDPAAGQVVTSSGQHLPYDRLLLATGASPLLPPAPGIETGNVFTLYRLDRVEAALTALDSARQVVVQGAGKVGVKAAEAVAARGIPVILVEQGLHLLPGTLDASSAAWLERVLASNGVQVVTGVRVAEVRSRQGQVAEIRLDSGARLPCDLFLIAIGGRPNAELARAAGIKVNQGIVVDAQMQTSVEGIFAAGDVAEAALSGTGQKGVVANWLNAVQQGHVAGHGLAGEAMPYPGSIRANAFRLAGLPVVSVGAVGSTGDGDWGNLDEKAGIYRRLVFHDGRLRGLIQVGGDVHDTGILSSLIKWGTSVAGLEARLFADGFALFKDQVGRMLLAEATAGVLP